MPHSLRLRKKIEKKNSTIGPLDLENFLKKKISSHYRRSLDLEKNDFFYPLCPSPRDPQDLEKILKKKILHYKAPGLRKKFEKKNSPHYRRSLDLEKKIEIFFRTKLNT